jgi:hypothetical protein
MNKDLEQLFLLMDRLIQLHDQMIATLDRQLAAARAADSATMHQCQQQTEELVRQIAQGEAQRRAMVKTIATQVGIDGANMGRGVTASRLAEALAEPDRSRLAQLVSVLRNRLAETDRLNKMLAEVSRRILLHLKGAYDAVAQVAGTTGTYAANGRLRQAKRATLFEVVG